MNLSVRDTANLLSVSEKTIYRWIKQQTIPAYRVAGSVPIQPGRDPGVGDLATNECFERDLRGAGGRGPADPVPADRTRGGRCLLSRLGV